MTKKCCYCKCTLTWKFRWEEMNGYYVKSGKTDCLLACQKCINRFTYLYEDQREHSNNIDRIWVDDKEFNVDNLCRGDY